MKQRYKSHFTVAERRRYLSDIDGALDETPPQTEKVSEGSHVYTTLYTPEPTPNQDQSLTGDQTDLEKNHLAKQPPIIFELNNDITQDQISKSLGVSEGDFNRLLHVRGIEALGWYLPFHYTRGQYGIYISEKNMLALAYYGFSPDKTVNEAEDLSRRIQAAFFAILHHEAFHFATEVMVANMETIVNKAAYLRSAKEWASEGYNPDEEACANAYMLKKARSKKELTDLRRLISTMPEGYNRGYESYRNFRADCEDLAINYRLCMEGGLNGPGVTFSFLRLFDEIKEIPWWLCPVILDEDLGVLRTSGLIPRFISKIPSLTESEKFRKLLSKKAPQLVKKWNITKQKLTISTSSAGLDFKPWTKLGDNCFSVRVDINHRAHIRIKHGQFVAEEIGDHDEMGH
jgi:hypothetical protein